MPVDHSPTPAKKASTEKKEEKEDRGKKELADLLKVVPAGGHHKMAPKGADGGALLEIPG